MLSVRNLDVCFPPGYRGAEVHAVRNVSFDIPEGGRVGLVGESGSGKTVTCLALTRLLPDPPPPAVSGQVLFGAAQRDLLRMRDNELLEARRHGIAYIFQDPVASLNPYMTIGTQFRKLQALRTAHRVHPAELLSQVSLPDPTQILDAYPGELSGGMCQRVCIALALAGNPRLLIADEPTTDLDVVTRNSILTLLRTLSEQRGMALLMVTHDLGTVAHLCDSVAVMNAGEIVEHGQVQRVFPHPTHEYTRTLLSAVPRIGDADNDA